MSSLMFSAIFEKRVTNRQTDGPTDGPTNRLTDEPTDRQNHRLFYLVDASLHLHKRLSIHQLVKSVHPSTLVSLSVC